MQQQQALFLFITESHLIVLVVQAEPGTVSLPWQLVPFSVTESGHYDGVSEWVE